MDFGGVGDAVAAATQRHEGILYGLGGEGGWGRTGDWLKVVGVGLEVEDGVDGGGELVAVGSVVIGEAVEGVVEADFGADLDGGA
jgi:hypothetical protein